MVTEKRWWVIFRLRCYRHRQHTVYIGEAPEYGKGHFFSALRKRNATVKKHYPDAFYLGMRTVQKIIGRF